MSDVQPEKPADDGAACDAAPASGPVREAGGTTGENNLSPQQANRTGGATGGVGDEGQKPSKSGTVPPSA